MTRVVILLLGLAACSKPAVVDDGLGTDDCGLAMRRTAALEVPGTQDEESERWTREKPAQMRAAAASCRRENWPPAVVECFKAAKLPEDGATCTRMLDPARRQALTDALTSAAPDR